VACSLPVLDGPGLIADFSSSMGGRGHHAADEKYNFERLQATMRLESQLLFTCVVLLFFCMTYGGDHGTGHAC